MGQRLIDANSLLKDIKAKSKEGYLGESGVIAMIERAETVKIAKYRKGKWGPCYEYNYTGMYYRDCPFCGKGTITGDFEYCPHCGAELEW